MNHLLKSYLRKFILVIFYDILIFNITWDSHVYQIHQVLKLLQDHKLFVKLSKCSFGMEEVEYLGKVVGYEGVRVDPKKIHKIQEWPQPKTLNLFRGFLGLTSYYHKFVPNYGCIAWPLTNILNKKSFLWPDIDQWSFLGLKHAICFTRWLSLPKFTKPFFIVCDALGTNIGAVLMWEGRLLAFTSQQISGKHMGQHPYEK